jgi:hypothetical protein
MNIEAGGIQKQKRGNRIWRPLVVYSKSSNIERISEMQPKMTRYSEELATQPLNLKCKGKRQSPGV